MPNSSFDSLAMPKPKSKPKKKWQVTKKNYNLYDLRPVQGMTDLHKMIANPAVKTLQKRLRECYRRLNKKKMAVTTVEHRSPRPTRRRSARRSVRRSTRRSVRRSPARRRRTERRSVRRSPPRRRSTRSYRRTDPIAQARDRARKKYREEERHRRRY